MPFNFRIFRYSLLMAAFVVLTQSESVLGSCGDYLHTKFDRPMGDFDETTKDSQAPAAKNALVADEMTARGPLPGPPCNGPGCRQQQDIPAAPAVPAPATSGHPVDGLAASSPAESLTGQVRRAPWEAETAARRGFPVRMERPPQAGN